jgi:hypothetical protein
MSYTSLLLPRPEVLSEEGVEPIILFIKNGKNAGNQWSNE